MTQIQAMTARVYRGGNGKRYFTKKAAALSVAKAAYREKHGFRRCVCSQETGPCDWCQYYDDHMKVVERYARLILRRPVADRGNG